VLPGLLRRCHTRRRQWHDDPGERIGGHPLGIEREYRGCTSGPDPALEGTQRLICILAWIAGLEFGEELLGGVFRVCGELDDELVLDPLYSFTLQLRLDTSVDHALLLNRRRPVRSLNGGRWYRLE
jgi:hypothetical protein